MKFVIYLTMTTLHKNKHYHLSQKGRKKQIPLSCQLIVSNRDVPAG